MRFAIMVAGAGIILGACHSRPATVRANEYADPASCAVCHAAIARNYGQTGMGRSFYRPRAENTLTSNSRFYHRASDTWYEVVQRDGKFYQRRWQTDGGVDELQIDYVMGSGNHVRTYLHRTVRGALIELPLGWYPEHGGMWEMNPGYDSTHPETRRKIASECMFCHNAYPRIPAGSEEAVYMGALPEGIDCQRCHGPGGEHVRAARAGAKNLRETIVNPARLSPERQIEVCMQCHLQTSAEPLPGELRRFGKAPFAYRAGEPLSAFKLFFDKAAGAPRRFEIVSSAYRLRQSQCFLKSGGKLVCETCHDPHATPHYRSVCLQCHATAHNQTTDCVSCHMPKRRTSDVVHAIMTDHLIQRRKPKDELAIYQTMDQSYRGEVEPYYPAAMPGDALMVAAAQVVNNSNLSAGIPRLAGEIAKGGADAEAYVVLGDAWRHSGRADQAAVAYEGAVKLNPRSARALRSWGVALKEAGQTERAEETLKRAVQEVPEDAESWYELGLLDSEQGHPAEAIVELRKAVALDPDLAIGFNNLGGDLAATGDKEGAEAAFREALRIDPYDGTAHANLGKLLASKGSLAKAAAEFAKAVKLQPEDAQNHYFYGLALATGGDMAGAARELRLASSGKDASVAQRAAVALRQMGR